MSEKIYPLCSIQTFEKIAVTSCLKNSSHKLSYVVRTLFPNPIMEKMLVEFEISIS